MKKLLTLIVAIVTVTVLAGVAQGQPRKFDDADFKAELTGAAEVPPVDTETSGEAKFIVAGDALDFELEVDDATDILGAAGAHIHCAPAGENGPVVAFLAAAVPGGFDGTVELKATLTDANIVDLSCGADIAALVESFRDGDAYVNVHSSSNPAGEVRGQIEES
jgi:Cu/Zn superoxide dismutase